MGKCGAGSHQEFKRRSALAPETLPQNRPASSPHVVLLRPRTRRAHHRFTLCADTGARPSRSPLPSALGLPPQTGEVVSRGFAEARARKDLACDGQAVRMRCNHLAQPSPSAQMRSLRFAREKHCLRRSTGASWGQALSAAAKPAGSGPRTCHRRRRAVSARARACARACGEDERRSSSTFESTPVLYM